MKPHRVPESVFEVEFKLFEFMTMKQFVIVAVTCGLAVGFYFLLDKITSPFVKWLVVVLISTFGLIVAFVTFQGEPFEVYVTNFILALVSPQRRVWEKRGEIPAYLKETSVSTVSTSKVLKQTETVLQKARKMPLLIEEPQQFPVEETTKFDVIEQQYLSGRLPAYGVVTTQEKTGQSIADVSSFKQYTAPYGKESSYSIDPTIVPGMIWGIVKDEKGHLVPGATVQILNAYGVPVSALTTNPLGQFRTGGVLPDGDYYVKVDYRGLKYNTAGIKVSKRVLEPLVFVPIPEVRTVEEPPKIDQSMQGPPQQTVLPAGSALIDINTLPKAVSFPESVTGLSTLCMLRGEVVDEMGGILPDVSIMIKAKTGTVIASVTTNQLGQFSLNSPLQKGEYVVELVKEGYWFNSYRLVVDGNILDPKRFVGKKN